jgi:hypothetical protein
MNAAGKAMRTRRTIVCIRILKFATLGVGESAAKDFEDFREQFGGARIASPFNRLTAHAQSPDLRARSQTPKAKSSDNHLAEELQHLYLRAQQPPRPLGDRALITIIAARPESAPRNLSSDEWQRLAEQKVDQKRAYALLSSEQQSLNG